jgi:hypothetical protein
LPVVANLSGLPLRQGVPRDRHIGDTAGLEHGSADIICVRPFGDFFNDPAKNAVAEI